jgi:histidine triad (HIT) family protein
MQEPSIFTLIINGKIPSHKIYEDDQVIAFLTNHPFSEGHTLVVPKKQIDQIWDLEADDYDYLWKTAQKIALHLRKVMDVARVAVVIKGFVPHTHIHLVPIGHQGFVNLDPMPEPSEATNDYLASVAERIRL